MPAWSVIVERVRRVVLVVATWAVGTLLAVTLAWWAVGRVSSEVVDRPAAPLSDREVALALGVEAAGATVTTTSTAGDVPATAVVPGATTASPASSTTSPARRPPGPSSTVGTTPTTVPRAAVQAPSPSSPSTSTPATTAPAPEVTAATIDSVGGQVAVRYAAGRVELVWARPKAGFQAEVQDAGPEDVEVRFVSDDHESRIRAFYSNGIPDREVREEADGDEDHEGEG